jgi:hypothetical protein
MSKLLRRRFNVVLLFGLSAFAAAQSGAFPASEGNGVTAVASKVSKDYVRTRLANGSFVPESYAFGNGGAWKGTMTDASIDKLAFLDVAHVIANPLAGQNYFPTKDPKTVKLLIMVYWGLTDVPPPIEGSVAYQNLQLAQQQGIIPLDVALDEVANENQLRDRTDSRNASMLGYDREGLIGTDYGGALRAGWLRLHRDDLISEIEDNRYFVVLMAYDFQLLWKEKKHRLLWETRFSINERHNQFDKVLPVMAEYAARYFGHDSGGLLRDRVREGRVEIGEPKSLGEIPEK